VDKKDQALMRQALLEDLRWDGTSPAEVEELTDAIKLCARPVAEKTIFLNAQHFHALFDLILQGDHRTLEL
jgi:hypothetical protein